LSAKVIATLSVNYNVLHFDLHGGCSSGAGVLYFIEQQLIQGSDTLEEYSVHDYLCNLEHDDLVALQYTGGTAGAISCWQRRLGWSTSPSSVLESSRDDLRI